MTNIIICTANFPLSLKFSFIGSQGVIKVIFCFLIVKTIYNGFYHLFESNGRKTQMLNLSTNKHPVTVWGKPLHKNVGWLILTGILANSSTVCQEIAMHITNQVRAKIYPRMDELLGKIQNFQESP